MILYLANHISSPIAVLSLHELLCFVNLVGIGKLIKFLYRPRC